MEFEVGQLILHSSMNRENGENWKGMCKAVDEATRTITIFWFHNGETSQWPQPAAGSLQRTIPQK